VSRLGACAPNRLSGIAAYGHERYNSGRTSTVAGWDPMCTARRTTARCVVCKTPGAFPDICAMRREREQAPPPPVKRIRDGPAARRSRGGCCRDRSQVSVVTTSARMGSVRSSSTVSSYSGMRPRWHWRGLARTGATESNGSLSRSRAVSSRHAMRPLNTSVECRGTPLAVSPASLGIMQKRKAVHDQGLEADVGIRHALSAWRRDDRKGH
jgi:hypothetical protein